jgi:hypothetical protein
MNRRDVENAEILIKERKADFCAPTCGKLNYRSNYIGQFYHRGHGENRGDEVRHVAGKGVRPHALTNVG